MEQRDRLAYEAAMATLRDTREDCLRWLDDQKTTTVGRRRPARHWLSSDPRPTPTKRRFAS